MTTRQKAQLRSVALETMVYAVLVAAYCSCIFRFMGQTLADLFHHHRTHYAFIAILLMVIQGLVLEIVARAIVSVAAPRAKDA